MTLGTIIVAVSVALMVAGEAGAALVLFFWTAANWLGLPPMILGAALVLAALVTIYLALLLFVRVMRVDARIARGQSYDDIGWTIFKR